MLNWLNDEGNSAWLFNVGQSLMDGNFHNIGAGMMAGNDARAQVYARQQAEQERQAALARQEEMQRRQDEAYARQRQEQQLADKARVAAAVDESRNVAAQNKQYEAMIESGLLKRGTPEAERALFLLGTDKWDTFAEEMQQKSVTAQEAEAISARYNGTLDLLEQQGALPPEQIALFRQNGDPKEQKAYLEAFARGSTQDLFAARNDRRDHRNTMAEIEARAAGKKPGAAGPSAVDVNRVLKAYEGLPKAGDPKGSDEFDAAGVWTPDEVNAMHLRLFRSAPEAYRQITGNQTGGIGLSEAESQYQNNLPAPPVGAAPQASAPPQPLGTTAAAGQVSAAQPMSIPPKVQAGVAQMRSDGKTDEEIVAAMREAGVPDGIIAAALR